MTQFTLNFPAPEPVKPSRSDVVRSLWQDSEYRARMIAERKARWSAPGYRDRVSVSIKAGKSIAKSKTINADRSYSDIDAANRFWHQTRRAENGCLE